MAHHTLFFSPGSCSFGAIVALEWANVPYNLCMVDRAQKQSEAYKKINDQQQAPALLLGDYVLTENPAILQHIAKHKPQLYFKQGTHEFDRANMILAFFGSNFHVAFHPFFAAQRFHDDEAVQAQIKDKAITNIRAKYKQIEQYFAKDGTYIMGEKPSLVDAYVYGLVRWGGKIFDIAKEAPHVAKFMATMEKDPAVQFALAMERGENAKSGGKFQGLVKLEDVQAPQSKAA